MTYISQPADELATATTSATTPQCIIKDETGETGAATNISEDRLGGHKNDGLDVSDKQQLQQSNRQQQLSPDHVAVGGHNDQAPSVVPNCDAPSETVAPALVRLGILCQEYIQACNKGEYATNNDKQQNVASGLLFNKTNSGKDLICPATASRKPFTRGEVWGVPLTPKRHPLDTLRKRGFGNGSGRSEGYGGGGGVSCGTGGGGVDEVVVAKLRTALRREQEERARERKGREVSEDQARLAYTTLEAESKR